MDLPLDKKTVENLWTTTQQRGAGELRWLNTVLRAVSGNSRDRAVFVTNKHGGKKAMVHRRRFLKIYSLKFCDIWQNFYFYRILDNEIFKMEVEQMNFVTHLIITIQLYY